MSDEPMDKATMRWKQIEKFLETHPFIMNADVWVLCSVSAATAYRILAGLAAERRLVKYREGGHWAYVKKKLIRGNRNNNHNRFLMNGRLPYFLSPLTIMAALP